MAFRKQKKCIDCGIMGVVSDEKLAYRSLFFDKDILAIPNGIELRALSSDEIYSANNLSHSKSTDEDQTVEIGTTLVSGLKFPVCYKKRSKLYTTSSSEPENNVAMWNSELWDDSRCPEYVTRVEGFSPSQHLELERLGRTKSWSSFGIWTAITIAILALIAASLTFLTYYEIVL